jgi:hypothetical protein
VKFTFYSTIQFYVFSVLCSCNDVSYRGADKSLARPGREQATVIEDFEFHVSYL